MDVKLQRSRHWYVQTALYSIYRKQFALIDEQLKEEMRREKRRQVNDHNLDIIHDKVRDICIEAS